MVMRRTEFNGPALHTAFVSTSEIRTVAMFLLLVTNSYELLGAALSGSRTYIQSFMKTGWLKSLCMGSDRQELTNMIHKPYFEFENVVRLIRYGIFVISFVFSFPVPS
jgi:hypothetical protein